MVASISSEALSEIIDAIYASATNPALWTAALRRINEATECRASVVGIVSFEEDFSLVNATAGFDEGFARRYGSNLPALSEIWGGDRQIAARPMHEPVVLSLHHPQALVRGTPQHDLLCEVLGFEVADTLNLPMKHLGRAIGASGFARAAGEGCFEPELYRLFRLLSPHIQRSADINRLLDAQALSTALRDGLLEHLRSPVAVVDGRMRLVQANSAARAALGGGDERLPRDLAQAVAEIIAGRGSYRCVASPGESGDLSHVVHVMALDDQPGSPLAGYAALVFAPAREIDPASIASIAERCGLTEAETAVLQHLVFGKSSASIAASLELQPSTVRTHILRIFDKLDVHHRAELVARVNAMASPFASILHQTVDAPPPDSG